MDTLRHDIRFAIRSLLRSPGYALVAILCLALGIAANVTVFTPVNTLLLRPLPSQFVTNKRKPNNKCGTIV